MRNRIFVLVFIALILVMLSSCSSTSSDAKPSYDISSDSFKISNYDFQTYTTFDLKEDKMRQSYGFEIKATCKYSLNEYTANVEFYSKENQLLYSDIITKTINLDANEIVNIQLEIEEEVFEQAYNIEVLFAGKSNDKPTSQKNSKVPFALTYYDLSLFDDEGLFLKNKYKSNSTVSEDQILNPVKLGYVFDGWYLDSQRTQSAIFPINMQSEIQLYADWLRTEITFNCENAKIKDWGDRAEKAMYNVTPKDFDFDRLKKEEYSIKVTITYDVYYKKDYDVPFDIGYMGAPQYEMYFRSSNDKVYGEEDLSTSTSTKTRTFEVTLSVEQIKNRTWYLEFSTDNIQNLIYFKNVTLEYKCVK